MTSRDQSMCHNPKLFFPPHSLLPLSVFLIYCGDSGLVVRLVVKHDLDFLYVCVCVFNLTKLFVKSTYVIPG